MANPKKGTSQARNEFIWGWAFILPTMLGLIILNIYPIFKTIYESFFKTGDFGKGNIFIGFDNYVKLFHDAEVWQALLNTFKYAIVEVPFSIAIALVLAVLLNRKMKGRAVYRTIFFPFSFSTPVLLSSQHFLSYQKSPVPYTSFDNFRSLDIINREILPQGGFLLWTILFSV